MAPNPENNPVPKKATSGPTTSKSGTLSIALYTRISTAAVRINVTKLLRRPNASLTYPNDTYPRNVPICIVTTRSVVVEALSPRPPRDTGSDRYAGTHRLSPQYANTVVRLRNVSSRVVEENPPKNASRTEGRPRAGSFCEKSHISDSWTCR